MFNPQRLTGIGLAALSGLALAGGAEALSAEDHAGVEQARQALGREGFPWYDNQHDALRPVPVTTPWNLPSGSSSNWPTFAWGLNIWELLLYGLFAVALVTIVWILVRTYLNREEHMSAAGTTRVRHAAIDDAARIEALPFRIGRNDLDLLDEARRLYEAGKYGEAIVYLFSFQLVEMDRHQVVRLAKGKTNRQYLRELRRRPTLRSLIERSMIAFEDVFFGGHPLDRARFESIWQEVGPFQEMMTQQATA